MQIRPISSALVTVLLATVPATAMAEIYKWTEGDGVVHYSNTPPAKSKNVRLVGKESGTVSVVPGMSKEEKDRYREREDQLRLQRLEREVEELRTRELARDSAQPEVIYTEVYVPAYGYGPRRPLHDRNLGQGRPRPEQPIAKPGPSQRTPALDEPSVARPPAGGLRR